MEELEKRQGKTILAELEGQKCHPAALGMAGVSFVVYGISQLCLETQRVYLKEKWESFCTAIKRLMG